MVYAIFQPDVRWSIDAARSSGARSASATTRSCRHEHAEAEEQVCSWSRLLRRRARIGSGLRFIGTPHTWLSAFWMATAAPTAPQSATRIPTARPVPTPQRLCGAGEQVADDRELGQGAVDELLLQRLVTGEDR